MPVVLLSPPAPGLSWVSAINTGRVCCAAKAKACVTTSRAGKKSMRHCAGKEAMVFKASAAAFA